MPISSRFARFAPKVARFLLTAISDNLPHARRLVHAAPLSATDGGDNGDYTVSVAGATGTTRGVLKLAGQLGGVADSPDVRGLRATGPDAPALLPLGDIAEGQVLARVDDVVVGIDVVPYGGGAVTADLDMGGHKVTGLGSGTASDDAATYGQLTSMLNGLDWQPSVVDVRGTVPSSPADGARFVITATPGAWSSGAVHDIAVYSTTGGWNFLTPTKGTTVNVETGALAGTDITFNGTIWVNLGASVDHNATLNRSADDAHSQYQLGAEKDATNGYAGLASGIVTKPVKLIRLTSDPGSPNPGEVWVNGVNLKYQNNNGGSGQTETVERLAMKDQNYGYAGLDSIGRIPAAHAPAKATYSTGGGSEALVPADIGAEPAITSLAVAKGGTGATTAAGARANLGALATAGDTMSGDLAMGGHKVTGLASGTATGDAATYGQLSAMLNGLDWQASVLRADLGTAPGSPADGERHVITGTGGAWSGGTAKDIATYHTAGGWTFITPSKGATVNVESGTGAGTDIYFDGSNWVNIGASVDHAALLNLTAGNPHTQYQLVSGKDANFGYAGLDSGGRVLATHAPPKATYSTGGDQALAPADIGAPPNGRSVGTGAGLSGGGDLTADRTLSITAFTGLVSKDADPGTTSYGAGITVISGASVDIGSEGTLIPVHIRLPPALDNTKWNTEALLTFSDNSTAILVNSNNGTSADFDLVTIADIMMGNLSSSATNNGKRLQKVTTQVHNLTGGSLSADFSAFRVRAFAVPRGGGSAL